MKKSILALLTLSLLCSAVAGCNNTPDSNVSDSTTSNTIVTTMGTTTEIPKQTEENKPNTTTAPNDQQPDTPPETTEKREHYNLIDYSTGLTYFTTESDMTAQVDWSEPNSSTVVIPSTIYGYQVIGIKEDAFAWNELITKVTIPASVKQIDTGAFTACANLTAVVFENPEGWTVNGEIVDLSDSAIAAQLLTDPYSQAVWVCN